MSAIYSLNEVKKHNVKGDLWLIIEGKVYNVTTFAADVSFSCFILTFLTKKPIFDL